MNRILVVLIAGFGALVALIAISAVGSARRATQIYAEVSTLNASFQQAERALSQLLSDFQMAGIVARDLLLEPAGPGTAQHRERLQDLHAAILARLAELARLVGPEERPAVERLEHEIEAYFDYVESALERVGTMPISTVRRALVGRRETAIAIARGIANVNELTFRREQDRIEEARRDFRLYLRNIVAVTVILALLVAAGCFYWIVLLQRHADEQRRQVERAGQELRRLSSQLVRAQEDVRRSISRELHDEVGQTLTALGMELGNLERMRQQPGPAFDEHLREARRITQDTLRTVRELAMGLRPSLLDDSGLAPALNWQAREFSRVTGIPVTLQIDGTLDGLPDTHRTCVYRVVQEALTNCARHAKAKSVRVALHGKRNALSLVIQDDGVGFPASAVQGMGLLGIQERVHELGGTSSIQSQPGRGTLLQVELPTRTEVAI